VTGISRGIEEIFREKGRDRGQVSLHRLQGSPLELVRPAGW